MRSGAVGITALWCLFAICAQTMLPQQSAHTAEYKRSLWQVADGLPEDTVQALVKAADGALWVGTTGGLAKTGGGRFRIPIPTPSVTCIASTSDRTLWVGTDGGGLLHLVGRTARTYTTAEGLTSGFVRTVFQDRRQRIWVGTDRGLFQVRSDHIVPFRWTGEDPDFAVRAMVEGQDGSIWVGGPKLVEIRPDGHVQPFALPAIPGQHSVLTMLRTNDHTLWFGVGDWVARLEHGKLRLVRRMAAPVRALLQTRDGMLWVGTAGDGLWRYSSGMFLQVRNPDMLPSSTVLALLQDQFGQLWIGTRAGLVRLEQSALSLTLLPEATDSGSGTVTGDSAGVIWVAAGKTYALRNGKVRPAGLGLEKVAIKELFLARDGAFWAGTETDGAYRVLHGQVEHYSAPGELAGNSVRGFLESRKGDMWVGTDNGVSVLAKGRWSSLREADGLAYSSTRCLVQDRQSTIWIGTDHGLSAMQQGQFVQNAATRALAQEKIWSILQDRQGAIWFGTREHGLFRWQNEALLHESTEQGLPTNSIYEMLQDRNGTFWVSGPNIIFSLQEAELATPLSPLNPVLYAIPSNSVQMYGGQQPAGYLAPDGTVWFLSNRGVAHIAVSQMNSHTQPPQIYEISDQGYMDALETSTSLPPDVGRVSYRLVAMYLRPQDALRFRYKLDGTDTAWNQIKPDELVTYTNLKPGHHRLHVQAIDFATPGAMTEKSVDIYRAPHFYQTWWFYVAGLCGLALIAWLFYTSRLRQVRSRFSAVLEERNRLAREMHDTVIQGCTGMSVLIEAIHNAESDPRERNELLTYAKELASATVNQAREAVWTMRHAPETMVDLGNALDAIAAQTQRDHKALRVIVKPNAEIRLPSSMAHEVIMTVREAVYNAVQHSATDRITLSAVVSGSTLVLEVEDYGSGLSEPADGSQQGHYGIVGMQERIKRVGGTFTMDSKNSGGTRVRISIHRSRSLSSKLAVH